MEQSPIVNPDNRIVLHGMVNLKHRDADQHVGRQLARIPIEPTCRADQQELEETDRLAPTRAHHKVHAIGRQEAQAKAAHEQPRPSEPLGTEKWQSRLPHSIGNRENTRVAKDHTRDKRDQAEPMVKLRRQAIMNSHPHVVDAHKPVGLHQAVPRSPNQENQFQPMQVLPR